MERIITERLIIRKFVSNDWLDMYEYLSNPEVVKYEPYDVFSVEEAKESAIRRAISDSFYAVCLKDTKKLIGNLYLDKGQFETFELGFVFNPNYQHQGYAYESSKAIMDYAFQKLGARRIIAYCATSNRPSWQLMEKLKMRREGCLIQNVCFKTDEFGNPIYFDTYEYAILKQEWKN